MKTYTKEEAIRVVVECAEMYKNELDGKTLLFLCSDKHKKIHSIEFSFYGNNYMHLTGLKASDKLLHANDFYQKCLDHKLSPSDFEFAEDGTTHMKLGVLQQLISKNLHANMIGNYNSAKPRLYTEKIAGNVHACMGFVFDSSAKQFVPNTVLNENAKDVTVVDLRVIAVYRKSISDVEYKERTYKAKGIDLAETEFPEKFAYLKP